MTIVQVIELIREAVSRCDRSIPEKDLLDALVGEAEGWKMRLEELEDEASDQNEE